MIGFYEVYLRGCVKKEDFTYLMIFMSIYTYLYYSIFLIINYSKNGGKNEVIIIIINYNIDIKNKTKKTTI